jgi:hypothetical protein
MLALVLQISPEEVPVAEELVALICDLEPTVRKDCEFIVFVRKDVEQSDRKRLLNRLEPKFARVRVIEAWDYATGWPHGPNTMWCSLIRQLFHMGRMDELASNGALTFECDCIPVRHDWISLLSRAWEEALAKGKEALGHFHGGADGTVSHMNGNAIFATDFFQKHEELTGCHGEIPWDVAFAPTILKVAANTPYIDQWYRMMKFDMQDWKRIARTPCAFFHGVKVPDGRRIAREQLIDHAKSQHKRRS